MQQLRLSRFGGLERPPPPIKFGVHDDYDDADAWSSCDDEEPMQDDGAHWCFLCDPSDSPAFAVPERVIMNLRELLYGNIGRCAPRYIARNVHLYYKHAIALPFRLRQIPGARNDTVRMWRTRDVLRHLREHEPFNTDIFADQQMRRLNRMEDSLALQIEELRSQNLPFTNFVRLRTRCVQAHLQLMRMHPNVSGWNPVVNGRHPPAASRKRPANV